MPFLIALSKQRPLGRRTARKARSVLADAFVRRRVRDLRSQNKYSSASVLGTANAAVSITTHGRRIDDVYLAIESIGAGVVRPNRMVLWLDDEKLYNALPATLESLQKRGLEIRLTENYGPHTKYYPFVRDIGLESGFLVTADDDVILPRWWLANLLKVAESQPESITCYRAHLIRVDDGAIAPYGTWKEVWSNEPSFLHLLTGVSGCAYPPFMVAALQQRGEAFLDRAPKADDVWIHSVAIESGVQVRQVFRTPLEFPLVPKSQTDGLYLQNVMAGQNDEQIRATYSPEALRKLEVAQQAVAKRRIREGEAN